MFFFVECTSFWNYTSDANWLVTIEKMTITNKVKTMVPGDMFIHIPVHVAVLIIPVRVTS